MQLEDSTQAFWERVGDRLGLGNNPRDFAFNTPSALLPHTLRNKGRVGVESKCVVPKVPKASTGEREGEDVNDDRWPTHRCPDEPVGSSVLEEFRQVVSDARDERPVQTFLAAQSQLLVPLLPPGTGSWCWDRPRFGAELIPDFLLCTRTSRGFEWVLVELESPTKKLLTRAGIPTAALNTALAQVRDWRAWLRTNVAYAQNQLEFTDLAYDCVAYIVIGRRDSIHPSQAVRYRELSDDTTRIMTFDRLFDALQRGRPGYGGANG